MSDTPFELQLIDEIYAAALDQARWQRVLQIIARKYPDQLLDISIHDRSANLDHVLVENCDSGLVENFRKHYHKVNPWAPYKIAIPVAPEVSWAHKVYPIEKYLGSEFYNDFMKPAGNLEDSMGTVLFRDSDRVAVIASSYCLRYQDSALEVAELLRTVSPHMQRSLELSRKFQGGDIAHSMLSAALDCLEPAAFVIDSRNRLVLHNNTGEALLRSHDVVYLNRESKLHCLEPDDDCALAAAIATHRTSGNGAHPSSSRLYLRLKRPHDNPVVALIAPLILDGEAHANVFNSFGDSFRLFLVLLIAPGQIPRASEDMIMMALGVTKAEARLAVSLLAGKSMQEHADEFRISKNTVRTQIKSLFNKTDTRGQAGLVRRLTTLFSAYRQA